VADQLFYSTENSEEPYNSVTHRLHGYILAHQQLSRQNIGNRPATGLETASYL
jgi:hypothetical protein